jgi:hypothetical protein
MRRRQTRLVVRAGYRCRGPAAHASAHTGRPGAAERDLPHLEPVAARRSRHPRRTQFEFDCGPGRRPPCRDSYDTSGSVQRGRQCSGHWIRSTDGVVWCYCSRVSIRLAAVSRETRQSMPRSDSSGSTGSAAAPVDRHRGKEFNGHIRCSPIDTRGLAPSHRARCGRGCLWGILFKLFDTSTRYWM